MSKYHGEWQAQGEDIKDPPRGHRVQWGQDNVPTKDEGRAWLLQVAEQCTKSEYKRRVGRACRDARRFVARAPAEGHPSASKHFYADDDSYPDARIDLEIYGMAFRDSDDCENG